MEFGVPTLIAIGPPSEGAPRRRSTRVCIGHASGARSRNGQVAQLEMAARLHVQAAERADALFYESEMAGYTYLAES